MRKRANILQFSQEKEHPENELEDLLRKNDDPENEFSELLFKNLDCLDSVCFQDDEDDYIIFLEKNDLLVDGDDGAIDFIASREKTELSTLLANGDATNPHTFAKNRNIPLVRNVEVLLAGSIGISRKSDLPRLGIRIAESTLILDSRWEMIVAKPMGKPYATETWLWRKKDIRLETTLSVRLASKEEKKILFTSFINNNGSGK